MAVAHYLWPPRWLVDEPAGASLADGHGTAQNPADLGEVVFDSTLPDGIRMRACRDGMLVWDCTEWAGKPLPEEQGVPPNSDAETAFQVKATRLMNVYLGCLHQAVPRPYGALQLVAPSQLLYVDFDDPTPTMASGSEPLGSYMASARRGKRLEVAAPFISHRPFFDTTPVEGLQEANDLLRQILELDSPAMALFRAEFLYRSLVAFSTFENGAALVNAWVAIEGLLNDHIAGYLDEEEDRPADGMKFINSERRNFLENSSSKITSEILSLIDRLPFSLYRDVREVARVRNKWLHDAAPDAVKTAQAELAIQTAGKMFELVEGVPFSPPRHRVVENQQWFSKD